MEKEKSFFKRVSQSSSSAIAEGPGSGLHQFFRKRANFPKYKKKFRHDSIRFPQGVELDEAKQQIRLPKIGWVGYRKSRDIIGAIKNVIVSRRGEKWDVSIQTEYKVVSSAPNPSEIGIDMGVNDNVPVPLRQTSEDEENQKLTRLEIKA